MKNLIVAMLFAFAFAPSAFAECHVGLIKKWEHDPYTYRVQGESCYMREEAQAWCKTAKIPRGYKCFVVRVD